MPALHPIQQLIGLAFHLRQARHVILGVGEIANGVNVGEELDQVGVITDENRAERVIVVHERVPADLVVEIPRVNVVRELLRRRESRAIIRQQLRARRDFEFLRFADVRIGQIVEFIVAHAELVRHAEFGDLFRGARDEGAVRLIEKRIEINARRGQGGWGWQRRRRRRGCGWSQRCGW